MEVGGDAELVLSWQPRAPSGGPVPATVNAHIARGDELIEAGDVFCGVALFDEREPPL